MSQVIEINQRRVFTLSEARDLLPIIRRITRSASDEVKQLTAQLTYTESIEKKETLEGRVQDVFQEWYRKIRKLGCEAKGMWLVDFDNGEGYYCWRYPEPDVCHFHGYSEGFRGRVRVH